MYTNGEVDASHITAFQFFMHQPTISTPLVIDNIRLLSAPSLDGIVDRFGQYTGYDWPGKIAAEGELAERLVSERAAIAKAPQLSDRDEYGGWAAGPELDGDRFFSYGEASGEMVACHSWGSAVFFAGGGLRRYA